MAKKGPPCRVVKKGKACPKSMSRIARKHPRKICCRR